MIKEIDFLKKEQRSLLSKKRNDLKKKNPLNTDFFSEKLNSFIYFKHSKIIASYFSIKSEISTLLLNEFIRDQDKLLCLPVISKDKKKGLIFKSFSKDDKLVTGKFNIKVPNNSKSFLPDIIFAPCLGFDMRGFRMGYGGGYYDKTISYLDSIRHRFQTVGLAYDDQKVDEVFNDDKDQKLDYILTEKQLYKIL